MRFLALIIVFFSAHGATADFLVPSRTIRAKEVISNQDLVWKKGDLPGAISRIEDLVGKEARVSLFPGRPIVQSNIGPAAIVDRNQIVTIHFKLGQLKISTEARVLERAAAGEQVRLMNLSSRTTITGTVSGNGTIRVNR